MYVHTHTCIYIHAYIYMYIQQHESMTVDVCKIGNRHPKWDVLCIVIGKDDVIRDSLSQHLQMITTITKARTTPLPFLLPTRTLRHLQQGKK